MKFIHCSDFHLDSALGHNLSPAQARQRNAELCATFGRMTRFAVEQKADAVLLAGDLFDSGYVSPTTAAFVLEQIRHAADVTFFYIRGNHDESPDTFLRGQLPSNLKCFGPQWRSYRCADAVVTAIEPEGSGWYDLYDRLQLRAEDQNIVMLHGQIAAAPGPEQIALPLLREKHIHYLALGHLHRYQQGSLDSVGIYCYSGCPEGRGFDECAEKGLVTVEIRQQQVHTRFVPFASRTLHQIPIDITDAQTVSQILSRMQQSAAGIPAQDMVRFVLTGRCTPQTQKDPAFLLKMMEPHFYCVQLRDESRLQPDPESYAYDISLKGEFIRLVLSSDHSDDEKERIIACGLSALRGEEVIV